MNLLADMARIIEGCLEEKGMSPEHLASLSRLAPCKIEALLAARPAVTTRELTRIAEALDLDPHALQRGLHEPLRSPAIFLKHTSSFQDFRHDLDGDKLLWVLDRGIALAALNPEGNSFRRNFRPVPVSDAHEKPSHHGHQLANDARRRLGLSGPVQDLRALLEQRLAIAVYIQRLNTQTSAVAVCSHNKTAAAILLNERRDSSSPSYRMTLAHELCHVLFDPAENGTQLVIESGGTVSDFEQRANAFAAEFLCPQSELRQMFPELPQKKADVLRAAHQIAGHFDITLIPALRQLQNRLDVPKDIVEDLVAGSLPFAQPQDSMEKNSPELLRLARKAWEEDRYSASQIRALLGLSAHDELPWPAS